MELQRSLVPLLRAVVVVIVSLLVVLVASGVLAPTATHDVSRSLPPFARFAGTERMMVRDMAVGLLVLVASTLTVRTALSAARPWR